MSYLFFVFIYKKCIKINFIFCVKSYLSYLILIIKSILTIIDILSIINILTIIYMKGTKIKCKL